jgi:cell division protein FtsI (penicillin-binding protein 3)
VKPLLRIRAVEAGFGLAVLVILGRAAQVQVFSGAEYAARAQAERTEEVRLSAARGAIYDRNGVPLALTQEVYHVGVAPNELRDPKRDPVTIARALGISERNVRRALTRRYAYFHGPYTAARVQPLRGTPGVHLTGELRRFHPRPDLAASLLGRPGVDGRPASGLERVFDSLLTGRDGRAVVLRDGSGRRYESPSRLDAFPVPGHDLYLTIDSDLQEIVEAALGDAIERYRAEGGDVIVLRPGTGEVLAAASFGRAGPRTAAVFTSVFEPGSTAKIFAAAALLAGELARPTDRVWAEQGTYLLNGRKIEDDHPSEWLTLQQVIEQSSNIGIVKLSARLKPANLFLMLRDFGLGTPTGVEFPAESRGLLKHPEEWSGTTAASLAMGYEVAVTPVQLAQAYATIANDGVLLQPTLIREIRAPDGTVVHRHAPTPVRRVVSAEVARTLRGMLRGVVYRGGTGETAALSTYEVAGKTGTARRAGPGGYIPNSYTASFASLFPAEDPQLVMVVKLDDPQGGYARLTAAPVTREVLEQLLATPSGALDRGRLTRAVVDAGPEVGTTAGAPVHVVAWPLEPVADGDSTSVVPDVIGLPLREAARRLHGAGLRVQIEGRGVVRGTTPSAGAVVARNTRVTIIAERAETP